MEHLNESWASSEGVAKSMRSNRRRDTGPELQLRRLLHAAGYRYRVDYPPLSDLKRRKADIVFTRQRLAVYVDGCFWHGCPQHATWPVANQEFWRAKLDRNRARDIETTEELERRGWTVLRIWEHIAPSDAMVLVERALSAVQPR